jgi:Mn2+/Fe2+ NRAMP family transporter
VLGLIGGVGGTITMAAYGYWVSAKNWNGIGWLPVMRLDNAVGYIMTGIFVVSMLVIGAAMLAGQDLTADDTGLLSLGTALEDSYGDWARILFLVGFLAVTTSSLLGVWNGVSLLFADWTRTVQLPHGKDIAIGHEAPRSEVYANAVAEKSIPFRFYLVWLTVPPMALLLFDQPFQLTLIYGVLGAAFMPFLGVTLMILLNSRRVSGAGRSGWLSNALLAGSSVLFLVLLVNQIRTSYF